MNTLTSIKKGIIVISVLAALFMPGPMSSLYAFDKLFALTKFDYGKIGIGGGKIKFTPHKQLKNYERGGGFYGQLTVFGVLNLSYSEAELLIKKKNAVLYGIQNRKTKMHYINLMMNLPLPFFDIGRNFYFEPTMNFSILPSWYKFKVNKEAFDKMGKMNLTKLKNGASKTGGAVGFGFSCILFRHLHIQADYNFHFIFEDWRWWYLLSGGIDGIARDQIETFKDLRVGINILF
jgi:hypothetical protein